MPYNKYKNSISRNERIILGCKANAKLNISEIADEYKTNREFVYSQQTKVIEILNSTFDIPNSTDTSILLTDATIKNIIFGCMVICKGSTENAQTFIQQICGIHVSIGKISSIINSFADKAKIFNDSILLDKIKAGANDEIFQAGKPVLVGVDVISTYIYLMSESSTRNATDWASALLEKQEQGLNLETSVQDGAPGIKKGVCDAFPKINMQSDIFHALRKIIKGMSMLERAVYKLIRKEYELQRKCLKAFDKNSDKYLNTFEIASAKVMKSIEMYDNANILYGWIKEAFELGGTYHDERIFILEYTTDELDQLENKNDYINAGIKYLRNHKKDLLTFVLTATQQIEQFAKNEDLPPEVLYMMWEQKKYSPTSSMYNILEGKIGETLKNRYAYIKNAFKQLMKKVVRASSMVECINSLIRPYLFLKRTVKGKFLDLLQFYFNTRKYRRSRCNERKGKSPIELLTNKTYPQPLEIIGY